MTIKPFIFTTVFCVFSLSLASTVLAQTNESTGEAAIQENLKERVKKAAEDQIKGVTTGVKKGFIGTVKRISEESMTLETSRGTLIVTLEDVMLIKNNTSVATSEIEIENSVTVLGYQNGEDFQPRRILVSSTSLRPTAKTVTIGNIKKIDKTSVTIQPRGTESSLIYSFQTKTKYQDKEGQTLKLADFETDQDVLIISQAENPTTQKVKDSNGQILTLRSLADTEKEP